MISWSNARTHYTHFLFLSCALNLITHIVYLTLMRPKLWKYYSWACFLCSNKPHWMISRRFWKIVLSWFIFPYIFSAHFVIWVGNSRQKLHGFNFDLMSWLFFVLLTFVLSLTAVRKENKIANLKMKSETMRHWTN